MTIRAQVTQNLMAGNYDILIQMAETKQSEILRHIQMHIYDDYRFPLRWHAIEALGKLTEVYSDNHDLAYRKVIRRCLWQMNDESANVPWAAAEIIASVIKGQKNHRFDEFVGPLFFHAYSNWMCHMGLFWGIGHMGEPYLEKMRPFLPQMIPLLESKDPAVRGYGVWALGSIGYHEADEAINALENDQTMVDIYRNGVLEQCKIADIYAQTMKHL